MYYIFSNSEKYCIFTFERIFITKKEDYEKRH